MIRSYQGKTPKIHPTAWVSEAAYVVGDVEIGAYSSVWPGSVIRADTIKITLGDYVDIQDNCVLHADSDATYEDYVTLGHGVISHAKHIKTHCLIGNGATINDGVSPWRELHHCQRRGSPGTPGVWPQLLCGGRAGIGPGSPNQRTPPRHDPPHRRKLRPQSPVIQGGGVRGHRG